MLGKIGEISKMTHPTRRGFITGAVSVTIGTLNLGGVNIGSVGIGPKDYLSGLIPENLMSFDFPIIDETLLNTTEIQKLQEIGKRFLAQLGESDNIGVMCSVGNSKKGPIFGFFHPGSSADPNRFNGSVISKADFERFMNADFKGLSKFIADNLFESSLYDTYSKKNIIQRNKKYFTHGLYNSTALTPIAHIKNRVYDVTQNAPQDFPLSFAMQDVLGKTELDVEVLLREFQNA